MTRRLLWIGLLAALSATPAVPPETLTMPSESPLVTFRIMVRSGSSLDPEGKEGAAALTAAMLSRAGTRDKTYDEIVEAMFPMAASVAAQVDKEMTVFVGTTHIENLETYYGLLRSMLLEPGWREDDFRRLKDEAKNFLRIQLRSNNEEELAKEFLFLKIFEDHPYGHHSVGTIAALDKLSIDDLKGFYKANYLQGNVVIGLAGGYPEGFPEGVQPLLSRLPRNPSDACGYEGELRITNRGVRAASLSAIKTPVRGGFSIREPANRLGRTASSLSTERCAGVSSVSASGYG